MLSGYWTTQHAEYDPYASKLIVTRLACSLFGSEMNVHLSPSSLVARSYGKTEVRERYYCNFGVNTKFLPDLTRCGFQVVGTDADGDCRIMELESHPFFVGTLFVPQARSTAHLPHPLINAFLLRAMDCFAS